MSEYILAMKNLIHSHSIISVVMLMVLADTFFGCLRALKEGKFNSCIGIDGAIRKVAMVGCLLFLVVADTVVNFNLIAFVPQEITAAMGIATVGSTEFFAILFIMYEIISILKNMTQCGLPTHSIEEKMRTFLGKYTDELPQTK